MTSEIQSTRYPCMVYLPTLGWCIMANVGKNIPYMDGIGVYSPKKLRETIYHSRKSPHVAGSDLWHLSLLWPTSDRYRSFRSCLFRAELSCLGENQSWYDVDGNQKFRREKLPVGCIKPCKSWGFQLPTSTGEFAGFLKQGLHPSTFLSGVEIRLSSVILVVIMQGC